MYLHAVPNIPSGGQPAALVNASVAKLCSRGWHLSVEMSGFCERFWKVCAMPQMAGASTFPLRDRLGLNGVQFIEARSWWKWTVPMARRSR